MSLVITLIQNLANDVCSQLEHDPEFIQFREAIKIGEFDFTYIPTDDVAAKILFGCGQTSSQIQKKFKSIVRKINAIAAEHNIKFREFQYRDFQNQHINYSVDTEINYKGVDYDFAYDIVAVTTEYGTYYIGFDVDYNLSEFTRHDEKVVLFLKEKL